MAYPTSPYRVFQTVQEAEEAVALAQAQGYPARIADGFARRVKPVCLWLYQRPDSHPEGKTITVYACTPDGLLYLRQNGEFQ